uniref:Large ribosomal subunit protein uL30m n=1 Tax=Daphnia lumholtzi TaxID=42856 RepID=A0A4Y7M6A0_9CRUS|nr:EOG090X0EYV [Daphnia lumholtzi]
MEIEYVMIVVDWRKRSTDRVPDFFIIKQVFRHNDPYYVEQLDPNYEIRFPGHQDPPYEPSKVLMVERIRDLKHRPHWEKDIIAKLGLPKEVKSSKVVIVANTPSMCAQLWKVKHLIRVTPITFPQGLPEDGDAAGALLQDNGELVFIPKLKSDALMAATQSKPEDRRDYLDTDTVKKHLRLKWLMPY